MIGMDRIFFGADVLTFGTSIVLTSLTAFALTTAAVTPQPRNWHQDHDSMHCAI